MKNDFETPPSDIFIDSMSEGGVGSDSLTCEFCGREHLCPDTDYNHYDDDECTAEESKQRYRQYCEEEHRKNPDKIVLHYDTDDIIGRYLNGRIFVLDCPCNTAAKYEQFIWEHKETIRKYLKRRIEHEYDLAQQQLTLNKLAGIE